MPLPVPVVRQNFGHQETNFAGGAHLEAVMHFLEN
jgi:hypothetical protein